MPADGIDRVGFRFNLKRGDIVGKDIENSEDKRHTESDLADYIGAGRSVYLETCGLFNPENFRKNLLPYADTEIEDCVQCLEQFV